MDMKKQDDKESVASLDESINCITTYDVPKTSNNQQKQQPVCITYLYNNIIHGRETLKILLLYSCTASIRSMIGCLWKATYNVVWAATKIAHVSK